jgi:hypothetical protein
MSLLGKILAVLNVLAALGFFLVAYMDWSKRQEWANAVVQHDLVINGLPVGKNELDEEGHPHYLNLRQSMLQPLLKGQIVRTQDEEVEQVRNKLQVPTAFDDPDPTKVRAAKVAAVKKLAAILMALADQQKQREDLQKRVDDAQAAAAKANGGDAQADAALQGEIDKMQSEVADAFRLPPEPADDPKEGPREDRKDERRRLIAHLLFRLVPILAQDEAAEKQQTPELGAPNPAAVGPGGKAYDRFVAVVGLEAASRELDLQAASLQAMAGDVLAGVERDRDGFLAAQRTLLAQIEDLSERDARQKTFLDNQLDLVQKHRTLVEARDVEKKRVEGQLKEAQDYTRQDLKAQEGLEKNLFEARKKMRDAFEENQKLEKQIRALEKVR